jgi:hypothetical protein
MHTIGRIDKADFPKLNLKNISLKVDTGAYTSSIHSHEIKEIEINNEKYIEFSILDPTHKKYNNKIYRTNKYHTKEIKNSFGDSEQRFVIQTTIIIFNREYPIDLSLSERTDMKFPILLGRKFLNKQFIVDTSKQNISYKMSQKEKVKKI